MPMAGIYLHIPFCRKACHYCNFHFSTSLRQRNDLLEALRREIHMREEEGRNLQMETVYLGGGTPSVLEGPEIGDLIRRISEYYNMVDGSEITLEANPDDLNAAYMDALLAAGVNRLSIGIQSFHEEDLVFMNRSHTGQQAKNCLVEATRAGFRSLSADLIYGVPGMKDDHLLENAALLSGAGVDHVSAYALTVEPRTALDHFVRTGKVSPPDDEQAARQYHLLKQALAAAGFQQYEISNWALPGRFSRHNTAYWQGRPYLGFGPSAHSFDGARRSWNVAHNPRYIAGIMAGTRDFEQEWLTPVQRHNEYLMTGLRTRWGVRPDAMDPRGREAFLAGVVKYVERGWIRQDAGAWVLSDQGQFFADGIAADLFLEEV